MVGKLLIKLSQERKVPIPVYAEMGSLNPVFFTPTALSEKADELAKAAIDSAITWLWSILYKTWNFGSSR